MYSLSGNDGRTRQSWEKTETCYSKMLSNEKQRSGHYAL